MSILAKQIKKLPDQPGVYFFLGPKNKILYIGKATSLRDRVRSYLSNDLIKTRSPLINKMIQQAVAVEYRQTDLVLEALLLEADLIKKFQPPHNTDEKDDKSSNCVVITKEDFPQVLLVRKKDLYLKFDEKELKYVFGPYPHGLQLREAMKIIRKIFPYRDAKCNPPRPCFNRQIGLCPGVCTGEISKKEYAKTIQNLKLFFKGKKSALVKNLNKQMNDFAKKKEFEKAAEVRGKIFAVNHIQDVSLIKHNEKVSEENIFRIEAYDVAHLAGREMVGAMVVMENGYFNKAEYRKFKIKETKTINDIAALKEVLRRRLSHAEWTKPDLVVLDGGSAQLNAATDLLKGEVPAVAVVKNEAHKPEKIIGDQKSVSVYNRDILLANNEVHRFVIGYHKKLRAKNWLT